ncbi:PTS system D-fructose-specific IIA component (F1P-forming) (Frc family) /PTS system D-fructose-specific IIB component (F1P-forming) (Frc family) /PTS system D-fructose-specific IIC component (F1P-forming) (Frc family) [Lacrimispora xylanisolvens]|uniref:PTS system D-fructose-specific IIA component (F1P-forming) (Frc family) /PTS system D-fructose-specific IIB component (F1P-forming) (Frc family) /PTS system D-fructose-specific IIC component (F1P-f... n=1 Tax=Lacrimispora xylanisolvens TaxID=384636 RepID=A0A2S6HQU9_9FIRM|nr:fructose-specific PTS transporter subunit EIIC [Hungatella xylanolytica]PPK79993.1 PTS system D-fructose-specific IIA component (F1P-forming) (Frc family) /PTS system D-fructose-specific IIB component (F1P-forming) (Frc family) /PTS system D-fructose-specific IIC component (F1P-forming) (Frc family) [Hungatella xylanolytica]
MKLLGVTGCPTGIAHTFMAEKALKVAAGKLGCQIKVETNGAIGVENALTESDIKGADAIIVASDKSVDLDRFNGKPVLEVSVGDGVSKAEELVQACLDGKVPVRRGAVIQNLNPGQNQNAARQIYKHLMNGVSHMLPLVVAGGVLIAISFLWGIYSFDPASDQYNPVAAMIKSVGGYSMGLMVTVLSGFIAQSIGGRPGLLAGLVGGAIAAGTDAGFLGGIVAGFLSGYLSQGVVRSLRRLPRQLEGLKSIFIVPIVTIGGVGILMMLFAQPCAALNQWMMAALSKIQNTSPVLLGIVIGCMCAFDMGGPVNKAAYVTGTVLLGQGNYYFMAGVSAACITPPLVLAIAATIRRNRFSEEDRTAALVNYVLGFTHITEGAIPFAAKNPLKVIPILMLSSSISAITTYLMKVEVPAPHGGFLILGLVNKPVVWVICILLGSFVGAVLYILVTPVAKKKTALPEDLLKEETVCLFLENTGKEEVIDEMVAMLYADGVLQDAEAFKKEIIKREKISSTAFGNGIAIPHGKSPAVRMPRVAVGLSKKGISFDSSDGEPVYAVFMIAVGENEDEVHLKLLSALSKKLMNPGFLSRLRECTGKDQMIRLITEE